jgi:hypothetical protein
VSTLSDLVDEVLLNLGGFDAAGEVVGVLGTTINSSATSVPVLGATYNAEDPFTTGGFAPGLTEIGDELVYVREVNRDTGVLTVIRGWRGSPRTNHLSGEIVRNLPTFPRMVVTRAVNDTIKALPPRVTGVNREEFTSVTMGPTSHALESATGVLSVRFQVEWGDSTEWIPSRRWRFDADPSGGGTLTVMDAPADTTVEATFTFPPVPLAAGDSFAVSGLPDWVKDTVVIGACWRVASFSGLAKLQGTAAEQAVMNVAGQVTPQVQTAQSAAKYFLGMFERRLVECEERFQDLFPAQKHYVN